MKKRRNIKVEENKTITQTGQHFQAYAAFIVLGLLLMVVAFGACKRKPDKVPDYDRAVLLRDVGNNVIVPAYDRFRVSAEAMGLAGQGFRANAATSTLAALQISMKTAWLDWKYCSAIEFGPAGQIFMRTAMNTFPADTQQIKANVAAGTWNLNQAINLDARGFPSLDFLLHGLGSTDSEIVSRYQNPADSSNWQAYLADLIADIRTKAQQVYQQWSTFGGNYLGTYQSSLGTDIGSSTGMLVNELNRDLEEVKRASIGIPLGKQTFGNPLPHKTEGYFAGYSVELAQRQLSGIKALFMGEQAGATNGFGLKEALDALEAKYNGGNLSDAIVSQFGTVETKLAQIPNPLSIAVTTSANIVDAAYNEIQKLVILLKTDMASALSILITYTDNDGD